VPAQRRTATKSANKQPDNLPNPPSLWRTIGPSFILLGIALGSGELLLWPYLTANFGLGLMWGALLGVTLQFFLNTEVMRFSLARGESVFLGFRRLSAIWPVWFILSTFIPWSLPGFSSAASQVLSNLFPALPPTAFAIILLIFTGIILTLGKTLYKTMEVFQRTVILLGVPFLLFLAFYFAEPIHWQEAILGLAGRGDGWWFFPTNIGLFAFLGAFAYSGAGGNLNLAQTYYVKEKGLGMGHGTQKISSLLSGGKQKVHLDGKLFRSTPANWRKWDKWWKLVLTEHLLVFWSLSFFTIFILSVLAYALIFGQAQADGIQFLYQEAGEIGRRTSGTIEILFLLVAAQMLFSTQIGVLESSSRIISENILLLFYKPGKSFNLSKSFYIALWGQISLGIIVLLLGFKEPRFLITMSAALNAAAMMVSFPLTYWLNKRHLPKKMQPGSGRLIIFVGSFIFFLVLLAMTILNS